MARTGRWTAWIALTGAVLFASCGGRTILDGTPAAEPAGGGGSGPGSGADADAGGPTGDARADVPMPPSPAALSNNSAELKGPRYGQGRYATDSLRKPIRTDRLDVNPLLTTGQAYAMRWSPTDTDATVAFQVTNKGTQDICFIELTGFRLKDASDATLVQPAQAPFVTGSVLAISPTLWTDACLRAGESGWLLDIEVEQFDIYGPVVAVQFQLDTSPATGLTVPRANVVPTGYTVSSKEVVTVSFKNTGTASAEMTAQGFNTFVALDDAGDPCDWDFLMGALTPVGILAPGAAGSVSGDHAVYYEGSANRLRVFIDFNSPGTGSAPLSVDRHFEGASRALDARLRRLRQIDLLKARMRGPGGP